MKGSVLTPGESDQPVNQSDPVATFPFLCGGALSEALLARLVADCLCPEWEAVGAAFSQVDNEVGAVKAMTQAILGQPEFLAMAALRLPDAEVRCALQPALTAYWAALPLSAWEGAVARYRAMWASLLGDHEGDAQAVLSLQGRLSVLGEAMPVLAVPLDWIQFRHLGAMPESILAVAKAQAPARLVAAWRRGDGSLLQRVLLRAHGPVQIWPSSMIGKRALAAFRQRVPESLASLMAQALEDSDQGIFWPHWDDHKSTAVNLPLLMGFWSASGMAMDWWRRQGRMQQLMVIQAFDPIWFQVAYSQGAKIALAYGLPSLCHGGNEA